MRSRADPADQGRWRPSTRRARHGVGAAVDAAPRSRLPSTRPRRSEAGRDRAGRVDRARRPGGPIALSAVLAALPADLAACPVVVTQHMPPVFTRLLAQRLELVDADRGRGGRPTGDLLQARAACSSRPATTTSRSGAAAMGAEVHLNQQPPVNYCRPAVDVMFESARRRCSRATCSPWSSPAWATTAATAWRRCAGAGAHVIVQDEATSVVWGMPGAVADAPGSSTCVLPLDEIGHASRRWS